MTAYHAVRIPKEKSAQLGPLRTLGGLEVHEDGDAIWLRMTAATEETPTALRRLPGATAYRVFDDGQLCKVGNRLPEGYLPKEPWESLSRWLQVKLPPSSLLGQLADRIFLQLVRDAKPREANLLLASMEEWFAYGPVAPQIRLDRWHFAVSTHREVLIRGTPLPPIPGQHFVAALGIAVPCGWHWSPPVDADVLARVFSLSKGDVILWRNEGRIERIAEDQFVRATRSAIRLSAGVA